MPADVLSRAAELIALQSGVDRARPFLDAGVGTGRMARHLVAASVAVVGVDVSLAMMERARVACPGLRLLRGDRSRRTDGLVSCDNLTISPLGYAVSPPTSARAVSAARAPSRYRWTPSPSTMSRMDTESTSTGSRCARPFSTRSVGFPHRCGWWSRSSTSAVTRKARSPSSSTYPLAP